MRVTAASPRKHSVDRLRILYANLLQCIDADNKEVDDDCWPGVVDGDDDPPNGPLAKVVSSLVHRPRLRRRSSEGTGSCTVDEDDRTALKKQELLAAFHYIAVNNSASQDDSFFASSFSLSDNGGANTTGYADVVSARALKLARKLEARTVKIIQEIGQAVVHAQQHPPPLPERSGHRMTTTTNLLRDDDTFAYFCEKAMLVLLVDIMMSRRESSKEEKPDSLLQGGVVWSPKVKAQVLQTVGLLVSGLRDESALHFVLSQNCVNQLIVSGMKQLDDWTAATAALEEILPAYTDLLRTLVLHLCGSPQLFPFYTTAQRLDDDASTNSVSFPLFSTTIRLTTSSHAQSDSYIHAAGLNLAVAMMRISDADVRTWIGNAQQEQQLLCEHLCRRWTESYRRIVNLTTGPVVDPVRSHSIGAQLAALDDQFGAINDFFSCKVNVFNLRLCEKLLSRVIHVLLGDLLPGTGRRFLSVGVSDSDVIPEREAAAQAASLVLARVFRKLKYKPFVRMLAVALWHPNTPLEWSSCDANEEPTEFYALGILNKLVADQEKAISNANAFREELLKALSGDYGEWRFVSAAAIVESAFQTVDQETLAKLDVLPRWTDNQQCSSSAVEEALASFLSGEHSYQSSVSVSSLECASSLAAAYIWLVASNLSTDSNEPRRLQTYLASSSLWRQLRLTKSFLFDKALEAQALFPVHDIAVDLIETVVQSRYKRAWSKDGGRQRHSFMYHLSQHSTALHCSGPEALTRKLRAVPCNDVEMCRFYAQMAIHCRAVIRVVHRWCETMPWATSVVVDQPVVSLRQLLLQREDDWNEPAEKQLRARFSCLQEKPVIGTDVDWHGRMAFAFTFDASHSDSGVHLSEKSDSRTLSDDLIVRQSPSLVLVVDPSHLLIVKPYPNRNIKRGTILCGIPLLDIVAAATDDSRLHVAVLANNGVTYGFWMQNGNLVIPFESAGTSLIVCGYLERCRTLLRQELYRGLVQWFQAEAVGQSNEWQLVNDTDTEIANELPHVKTF
jgi:Uncharacterised conserved protein